MNLNRNLPPLREPARLLESLQTLPILSLSPGTISSYPNFQSSSFSYPDEAAEGGANPEMELQLPSSRLQEIPPTGGSNSRSSSCDLVLTASNSISLLQEIETPPSARDLSTNRSEEPSYFNDISIETLSDDSIWGCLEIAALTQSTSVIVTLCSGMIISAIGYALSHFWLLRSGLIILAASIILIIIARCCIQKPNTN
jgi:hypothetical protein